MKKMKYKTTNELAGFDFTEAYIGEIRAMSDTFTIGLDNVKILPENTKNRDIRKMRTNELVLKIRDAKIVDFVEEGYKVYDANGNLKEKKEDRVLAADAYTEEFKKLIGCVIYTLKKEGDIYEISIDTEDHTYLLRVSGTEDTEEWERFLNLDA